MNFPGVGSLNLNFDKHHSHQELKFQPESLCSSYAWTQSNSFNFFLSGESGKSTRSPLSLPKPLHLKTHVKRPFKLTNHVNAQIKHSLTQPNLVWPTQVFVQILALCVISLVTCVRLIYVLWGHLNMCSTYLNVMFILLTVKYFFILYKGLTTEQKLLNKWINQNTLVWILSVMCMWILILIKIKLKITYRRSPGLTRAAQFTSCSERGHEVRNSSWLSRGVWGRSGKTKTDSTPALWELQCVLPLCDAEVLTSSQRWWEI